MFEVVVPFSLGVQIRSFSLKLLYDRKILCVDIRLYVVFVCTGMHFWIDGTKVETLTAVVERTPILGWMHFWIDRTKAVVKSMPTLEELLPHLVVRLSSLRLEMRSTIIAIRSAVHTVSQLKLL